MLLRFLRPWRRLPRVRIITGFLAGFLVLPGLARAQPLATDPYKYASSIAGPNCYDVNPEAWYSFQSFDAARIFGQASQQDFSLSLDYATRVIYLGKKAGGASFVPAITWVGPFFGGEGYTAVDGILPLSSPYAERLDVLGGWRYHLTNWLDLDLGGNFIFYNKSVFGQGLPAPWGGKSSSPIYVGFTGRVLGRPSLYFTYDPDLGQSLVTLSVEHVWDLAPLVGVPGLHVGAKLLVGLLQANDYNMGDKVLGQNWRNGYAYVEADFNTDYEVCHNVYLRAGVTWAINNDGSGSTGIAGTNLGPDHNLSLHLGVLYAF